MTTDTSHEDLGAISEEVMLLKTPLLLAAYVVGRAVLVAALQDREQILTILHEFNNRAQRLELEIDKWMPGKKE